MVSSDYTQACPRCDVRHRHCRHRRCSLVNETREQNITAVMECPRRTKLLWKNKQMYKRTEVQIEKCPDNGHGNKTKPDRYQV